MKKIVIFDEYNEIDFKPSDLLHQYIQLTEKDVPNFLTKNSSLKDCTCPGCYTGEVKSSFPKFGMHYVECANCKTLYVSPRPDDKALEYYYGHSTARKFWREQLSKQTKRKRKEKIIKPRFEWILGSTEEYLPDAIHILDINTDQYGYIEELVETQLFKKKTLLNSFLILEDLKLDSRIHTVVSSLEEKSLDGEVDVVTLFEVADRTANVDALFGKIYRMLRENGLCFMTDILISGFDLQTLWDKAENIFPPDRLNVFSVEGLKCLFQRHHFECLEFSTPGILDVEIVEKAIEHNPEIKLPRFAEYLLRSRNEETRRSFQEFLQKNLLSSYGRILLRKK
jgi:hypothetical protein